MIKNETCKYSSELLEDVLKDSGNVYKIKKYKEKDCHNKYLSVTVSCPIIYLSGTTSAFLYFKGTLTVTIQLFYP